MKSILLFLISIFLGSSTNACSFPELNYFPPPNLLAEGKGEKPKSPNPTYKVMRGQRNNSDSCSDTGVITINIQTQGYNDNETGYLFEVVTSTERQTIFPEQAIYNNSKSNKGINEFNFPWVDGAHDVQEPLKIVVNVYRVSSNWVMSEPTILIIENRGRL